MCQKVGYIYLTNVFLEFFVGSLNDSGVNFDILLNKLSLGEERITKKWMDLNHSWNV